MRANKPKSHPNAALMLHIIFSTQQAPLRAHHARSARVAFSKTSKNQRELVRFSSTILQIFRAHRTAHSKFCCNFTPKHAQRLPMMIARIFRSMRACSAPKSRRIARKIARFSIGTGAVRCPKCAQTSQNHIQTLKRCCTSSSAHIKHLSVRSALAAHVSRARKPPKTNANSCDFRLVDFRIKRSYVDFLCSKLNL